MIIEKNADVIADCGDYCSLSRNCSVNYVGIFSSSLQFPSKKTDNLVSCNKSVILPAVSVSRSPDREIKKVNGIYLESIIEESKNRNETAKKYFIIPRNLVALNRDNMFNVR